MRILLVSEDLPAPAMGGLARHVLALGHALTAAGHHVDLMGNDDHAPGLPGEVAGFGAGSRFFGELSGQFSGWKETQLGVFMPGKRSWTARRFARAILRRAPGYDVIHYHGHLPNVARHIPPAMNFIQTRHDQGSDCLIHTRFVRGAICTATDPAACASCRTDHPNWLQRQLTTAAVARYRREVAEGFARHKTVFVSELLRTNLQRSFGAGDWGVTLHNFIDPAPLEHARLQARQLPTPPVRAFVAAKLYPAKGVDALLAELVPRMGDGLVLDIAGDGMAEAQLRRRYERQSVRFHGWLDVAATLREAARAHAVVVPSVWEEPCATTVLEALALGKTTFALRRGGTPELAAYASAPDQLRLFDNMATLVDDLLAFVPRADRSTASPLRADAAHAAARLLELYRLPPGPLPPREVTAPQAGVA